VKEPGEEWKDVKVEFHVPKHVGETVVLQPEQKAVYASTTIEHSEDGSDVVIHDRDLSEGAGSVNIDPGMLCGGTEVTDILSQLRASVGGEDFKVFRSQVIRAFKHLALDTVKFFGE
jgi:hypothetical protein